MSACPTRAKRRGGSPRSIMRFVILARRWSRKQGDKNGECARLSPQREGIGKLREFCARWCLGLWKPARGTCVAAWIKNSRGLSGNTVGMTTKAEPYHRPGQLRGNLHHRRDTPALK